jgi:hypothetical protein
MIKESPADVAEAYKAFLEESKSIGTIKDLDYLYVKLKGTSAEDLIKEIEEEEKEDSQTDLERPKKPLADDEGALPVITEHPKPENVFLSPDDSTLNQTMQP